MTNKELSDILIQEELTLESIPYEGEYNIKRQALKAQIDIHSSQLIHQIS